MNVRTMGLILCSLFIGGGVCFAADLFAERGSAPLYGFSGAGMDNESSPVFEEAVATSPLPLTAHNLLRHEYSFITFGGLQPNLLGSGTFDPESIYRVHLNFGLNLIKTANLLKGAGEQDGYSKDRLDWLHRLGRIAKYFQEIQWTDAPHSLSTRFPQAMYGEHILGIYRVLSEGVDLPTATFEQKYLYALLTCCGRILVSLNGSFYYIGLITPCSIEPYLSVIESVSKEAKMRGITHAFVVENALLQYKKGFKRKGWLKTGK